MLEHRAAVHREHRRAAGHRLDGRQAEGFERTGGDVRSSAASTSASVSRFLRTGMNVTRWPYGCARSAASIGPAPTSASRAPHRRSTPRQPCNTTAVPFLRRIAPRMPPARHPVSRSGGGCGWRIHGVMARSGRDPRQLALWPRDQSPHAPTQSPNNPTPRSSAE